MAVAPASLAVVGPVFTGGEHVGVCFEVDAGRHQVLLVVVELEVSTAVSLSR